MKKYEKYKDSGVAWIGEIPASWDVVKCRDVVEEINIKNYSLSSSNYLSVMANIGVIKYEDKGEIGNKKPEDLSKCKLVKKDDIVINSMNYYIGSYGKSNFNGICSPVYIVLRTNEKKSFANYTFRIFGAKKFQELAQTYGNGILEHRKSISWDVLKNMKIPLPKLEMQYVIAKFLDYRIASIDKLINDKQRLIKKLKEYRQAIINEAVTKGLDKNTSMKNSGVDWIGEIPKDWDIKRLKNIGIFTRGSGIKKDDVNNEGIQCIRYGEIYTKYNHSFRETTSFVSEDIAKNCLQVSIDDILITLTGETKEDIGKAIVYLGDGRLVAGGDLAVLKCTNNNPSYVTYFLNAEISKLQKENLAVGEIIVHIGTANLQKIIIPLPDKSLQDKIVLFLDKKTSIIEATISNINVQITNLQEYKKSIIGEAVTGKIKIEESISEGVI